jgi:two-component system OmpR family response regulator
MVVAEILVVDDEPSIRSLLGETLRIAGFNPAMASDGKSALEDIRMRNFDLILLDINMPRISGFETLKEIRRIQPNLPVIVLSARQEKSDVIEGFRVGADDYISKPFDLEELIMRIKSVIRRSGTSEISKTLRAGPITLNEENYEVRFNDELVDLSKTEFRLLQYLMENVGRVVTKERLLDAIWGYGFQTTTTVVDTYISYLRKKLHREGFEGIKTIRGIGFQLKVD